MSDYFQTLNDAHRTQAQFLIADLDLAFTFLDTAAVSEISQTVQRNRANARKVYDTVLRYLPQAQLTEIERQTIQDKLATLRYRLERFGIL